MIAVAENHLPQGDLVPLLHMWRVQQQPGAARLLVDHQAQFVAEIQLVGMRDSRYEPDRVVPRRLRVI